MFETTGAAITDLETVMRMASVVLPVAERDDRLAYFRAEKALKSMRAHLAAAVEEWPKFQASFDQLLQKGSEE